MTAQEKKCVSGHMLTNFSLSDELNRTLDIAVIQSKGASRHIDYPIKTIKTGRGQGCRTLDIAIWNPKSLP